MILIVLAPHTPGPIPILQEFHTLSLIFIVQESHTPNPTLIVLGPHTPGPILIEEAPLWFYYVIKNTWNNIIIWHTAHQLSLSGPTITIGKSGPGPRILYVKWKVCSPVNWCASSTHLVSIGQSSTFLYMLFIFRVILCYFILLVLNVTTEINVSSSELLN